MNNIIQTIQHTARAAAMLLLALCAAQTAWAESPAIDPAHFSVNDAGTEYTIHTAEGWDYFCDAMQDNTTWNRFSGKTVKLGKIHSGTDPLVYSVFSSSSEGIIHL